MARDLTHASRAGDIGERSAGQACSPPDACRRNRPDGVVVPEDPDPAPSRPSAPQPSTSGLAISRLAAYVSKLSPRQDTSRASRPCKIDRTARSSVSLRSRKADTSCLLAVPCGSDFPRCRSEHTEEPPARATMSARTARRWSVSPRKAEGQVVHDCSLCPVRWAEKQEPSCAPSLSGRRWRVRLSSVA